jgi:hypothetical protein
MEEARVSVKEERRQEKAAEARMTPFFCPTHGFVLETYPQAQVECRCGAFCATDGEDPKARQARWVGTLKKRKQARRNRETPAEKPQVKALASVK